MVLHRMATRSMTRFAAVMPVFTARKQGEPVGQARRALGKEFDVYTEPKTGVEFPKTLRSWATQMETLRILGAGCREKKVFLFAAKVYAVGLYVEGATATREFGIRSRGGFFADASESEYCDAILDGSCSKLLLIQLVRDVEGDQFVQALEEALEPRMSLTGETATLQEFKSFFVGKQLTNGSRVLLLWNPDDSTLAVKLTDGAIGDYSQVTPDKVFNSAGLCRTLFEVWLGENCVIPEARKSFAEGVRQLIEADDVSRGEWKPGGRGTPK